MLTNEELDAIEERHSLRTDSKHPDWCLSCDEDCDVAPLVAEVRSLRTLLGDLLEHYEGIEWMLVNGFKPTYDAVGRVACARTRRLGHEFRG